ncbi:MAG: hypothetical protein JW751_16270 [Polyangiaceae bacterium]|nr:hypothetical protein [Polyangiaceae bacterium]
MGSANGSATDCRPYECRAGVCRESCDETIDCAEGYDCIEDDCVRIDGPAATGGTGTGGITTAGGGTNAGGTDDAGTGTDSNRSPGAGTSTRAGARGAAAGATEAGAPTGDHERGSSDRRGCRCAAAGAAQPQSPFAMLGVGLGLLLMVTRRVRGTRSTSRRGPPAIPSAPPRGSTTTGADDFGAPRHLGPDGTYLPANEIFCQVRSRSHRQGTKVRTGELPGAGGW